MLSELERGVLCMKVTLKTCPLIFEGKPFYQGITGVTNRQLPKPGMTLLGSLAVDAMCM